MTTVIDTCCHKSLLEIVGNAQVELRKACRFNPQLEYFVSRDRHQKCDYSDLLIEMVLATESQKVVRIAGKDNKPKSETGATTKRKTLLSTSTPDQNSYHDVDYLRVNTPTDPDLMNNKKVRNGIPDVHDVLFVDDKIPTEFGPKGAYIRTYPMNQMVQLLSGPTGPTGDSSTLALAEVHECMYFVRELYAHEFDRGQRDYQQRLDGAAHSLMIISVFTKTAMRALDTTIGEDDRNLFQESKWCLFDDDWESPKSALEMIDKVDQYRRDRTENRKSNVFRTIDWLRAIDCLVEVLAAHVAELSGKYY